MDDESGESMEPMEEVPLKELGKTESGAMTQIAYSESRGGGKLRMLLVNRVLKTNSFRECALKIALTRSTFQPQNALNIVWRPGSALTRWGSLQRSPRPPHWI